MLDAINREYLGKTKVRTKQTNRHRYNCGPTQREPARRIPIIDIVAPMTVYKVFDDENDCIGAQPVGNEEHETLQSLIKVATNGDKSKRNCDIHHCPDERPDIALDTHERLPENLHRETEAIVVRYIVCDYTQGE